MLHDAGTTVNKNPLIIYRISQTTAVNNSLQCALVTDEHNFNKYLEEFLSLLILNGRIDIYLHEIQKEEYASRLP